MLKLLLNSTVILYILTGCSSKQYFEPNETSGSYNAQVSYLTEEITTFNQDGATLKDYKMIHSAGVSQHALPSGYEFINNSDNNILAASKNGQLLVGSKDNIINFKKNIVSASLKGNLLAVVFTDNSVAIYDTETKKIKFREYGKISLVNDSKTANPVFLDDIILFPTLNGNLIIASSKNFKLIKTINIDPDNQINNIIFLKTINNIMIAATPNKILSLGDGSFSIKDYSISNIISHEQNLYLSTIEGNIIKLDLLLEEISSKKFKFAKIHALGYGSGLYALESQGFLIKFNHDLTNNEIYDFNFDETLKVIAIDDMLYFDDMYIKLD